MKRNRPRQLFILRTCLHGWKHPWPCGKGGGATKSKDVKKMLQDFQCPVKKCGQTFREHGNRGGMVLRAHIKKAHKPVEKKLRALEREMLRLNRAAEKLSGNETDRVYATEW